MHKKNNHFWSPDCHPCNIVAGGGVGTTGEPNSAEVIEVCGDSFVEGVGTTGELNSAEVIEVCGDRFVWVGMSVEANSTEEIEVCGDSFGDWIG